MMNKCIPFLLSMIFLSNIAIGQLQDSIYAVAIDDSVTIWHKYTNRNCATIFGMDVQINGNHIDLYEVDLYGQIAYCMCNFNLSATITDLDPGFYTVDVYSSEAMNNWDTVYWGSTDFTILSGQGNPQLTGEFQSSCLNCPPPEWLELIIDDCYVPILTSGQQQKDLLGYNIYLNGLLLAFITEFTYYYWTPYTAGSYTLCVTAVCDEGESEPVCWDFDIPYGDPPENFNIEAIPEGASLTWEAPDGYVKDFVGYHIFRDFELLIPSIVTENSYLDQDVQPGILYQYYVTAVYDSCESLPTDTLDYAMVGSEGYFHTNNIMVFPNPANEILYIKFPNSKYDIEIMDLLGNKLLEESSLTKESNYYISYLKPGIYFLRIKSYGKIIIKKFIKG